MEHQLRNHIEALFRFAPQTRQASDLKEEIIMNTIQRYHDLLGEGLSPDEAYKTAVDGIGDIDELIDVLSDGSPHTYAPEQLEECRARNSLFKGIAVMLYITCIIPPILFSSRVLENIGASLMFIFVSTATGLLIYAHKTKLLPLETDQNIIKTAKLSAVMLAAAVGLYISCVVPPILLDGTVFEEISPIFMFLFIGAATFLIIIRKKPAVRKPNNEFLKSQWQAANNTPKHKGAYRCAVAVLWVTASVTYIILTVLTWPAGAPWIIFPLAAALQNLVRAIFEYTEERA